MSDASHPTPDELAVQVAEKMYQEDVATQHLGMTLIKAAPGAATMIMKVQDYMLNGHKTCHGGYMFMLADSAFAFACNSYNQSTVAQAAQINFLKPVSLGTLLTATATEVSRSGRTGLYNIDVTNEEGELVASFRGNSHTIKGQIISGLNDEEKE